MPALPVQAAKLVLSVSDMTAMSCRRGPALRGAVTTSLVVCLLALVMSGAAVRAALLAVFANCC